MDKMDKYHSYFIHSSSDGHLNYLQILTIVIDEAMNIGVHVFFGISVRLSLVKFPEVELLGHRAVPLLIF